VGVADIEPYDRQDCVVLRGVRGYADGPRRRLREEDLDVRYPAAETAEKHQRILREATRLFRDRGFDGVSIPQIMQAAGLTHGSFYNHFKSKDALVVDCIQHGATKSLSDMGKRAPTVVGRDGYIDFYLGVSHRDDPGSGCLMSAIGSEVHREPATRPGMTLFIENFIDKLASHFPWSSKARARRDSIRATAAMVGGLILARAVDDEALSLEILREVAAGLRSGPRTE
jgi:TetR/AcrR family transcriptional repressor of nem operon